AKWDGTNWSPVGNGFSSTVSAMAATGSNLYAGGSFSTGTNMYVARWDGTNWNPLGVKSSFANGVGNSVSAIATIGSSIYVGGSFLQAFFQVGGFVNVNYIAKWENGTWLR